MMSFAPNQRDDDAGPGERAAAGRPRSMSRRRSSLRLCQSPSHASQPPMWRLLERLLEPFGIGEPLAGGRGYTLYGSNITETIS